MVWLRGSNPFWKIWKSVGITIPNMWKNPKRSEPPTRYMSVINVHPYDSGLVTFDDHPHTPNGIGTPRMTIDNEICKATIWLIIWVQNLMSSQQMSATHAGSWSYKIWIDLVMSTIMDDHKKYGIVRHLGSPESGGPWALGQGCDGHPLTSSQQVVTRFCWGHGLSISEMGCEMLRDCWWNSVDTCGRGGVQNSNGDENSNKNSNDTIRKPNIAIENPPFIIHIFHVFSAHSHLHL